MPRDFGWYPWVDVGCWLFQLVFTQTVWFLLDAGMNVATEGNSTFLERGPDNSTISNEWTTRMCHLMARKPGALGKGKPLTRADVQPSPGAYGCLSGSCGEGCGIPGIGGMMRLECGVLCLVLGGSRARYLVAEAMNAPEGPGMRSGLGTSPTKIDFMCPCPSKGS